MSEQQRQAERRLYELEITGLGRAIECLTNLGEYFGLRGAIILDEVRAWYLWEKLGQRRQAMENLTSTYYGAAANAFGKTFPPFGILGWLLVVPRLLLAVVCLGRAWVLSNVTVRFAGGLDEMSIRELCLRAQVLHRVGKRHAALRCVEEAFAKGNVPAVDAILLYTVQAQLHAAAGRRSAAVESYQLAALTASQEDKLPASVYARFLRSRSVFEGREGDTARATGLKRQAAEVSEETGLADQI